MKIQEIRNKNKRQVLTDFTNHRFNRFVNRNNSFIHEKAKILKALELCYEGNETYVEVPLKTKGIADIYVSDINKGFEIMKSEKESNLKKKNYPFEVEVIRVGCSHQKLEFSDVISSTDGNFYKCKECNYYIKEESEDEPGNNNKVAKSP